MHADMYQDIQLHSRHLFCSIDYVWPIRELGGSFNLSVAFPSWPSCSWEPTVATHWAAYLGCWLRLLGSWTTRDCKGYNWITWNQMQGLGLGYLDWGHQRKLTCWLHAIFVCYFGNSIFGLVRLVLGLKGLKEEQSQFPALLFPLLFYCCLVLSIDAGALEMWAMTGWGGG